MRPALVLCASLALLATTTTLPARVAAAPSAEAVKKAKRYAKKAKKAYKKGRWDDAISGFELAHQHDPQPKYLFNIGRAYERKGDLFKAMEHVQTFIQGVEDEAEREDAQELYDILANKLRKTSGRLRLSSTPSGATVRLTGPMGELKGGTPMDRWLEAGSWKLEVVKQGLPPVRHELVLEIGGDVELDLDLHPPPDKPPAPESSPAPAAKATEPKALAPPEEVPEEAPPVAESEADPGSMWPMVVLGVGVAALAGGAVMGWLAGDKEAEVRGYRETPHSGTMKEARAAQDDAEARALVANVLYGIGGAAAATGLVLVVTW